MWDECEGWRIKKSEDTGRRRSSGGIFSSFTCLLHDVGRRHVSDRLRVRTDPFVLCLTEDLVLVARRSSSNFGHAAARSSVANNEGRFFVCVINWYCMYDRRALQNQIWRPQNPHKLKCCPQIPTKRLGSLISILIDKQGIRCITWMKATIPSLLTNWLSDNTFLSRLRQTNWIFMAEFVNIPQFSQTQSRGPLGVNNGSHLHGVFWLLNGHTCVLYVGWHRTFLAFHNYCLGFT